MWSIVQFPADLVTFTKEILKETVYFFVKCLLPYLVFLESAK